MVFGRNLKLLAAGLAITLAGVSAALHAKAQPPADLQQTISLAELPRQGTEIYTWIHLGGPFATEKDGVVFGNRERLLPLKSRGYYREYTVPTPGLSHRGVKRIVCGGEKTRPEVCYFTSDHYASFRRIVP
jgi:ribonuclease T1